MYNTNQTSVLYGSALAIRVWDERYVAVEQEYPFALSGTAQKLDAADAFVIVAADGVGETWGKPVCYGDRIALRASSGVYVQSHLDQGGALHVFPYTDAIREWETFEVVNVSRGDLSTGSPLSVQEFFALTNWAGRFVHCHLWHDWRLIADADRAAEHEYLRLSRPQADPSADLLNELIDRLAHADALLTFQQKAQAYAENRLQQRDGEIASALCEINGLKMTLDEQGALVNRLGDKASACEQQVTELEHVLGESQTREQQISVRETKVAAAAHELEIGQQKIDAVRSNPGALLTHLRTLIAEIGDHAGEATAEVKAEERRLGNIQDQLSDTEEQLSETRLRMRDLTGRLAGLRDALTAEQSRAEEAEIAETVITEEYERVLARLRVLEQNEERLRGLSRQLPELRMQVGELECRITPSGLAAEGLEASLQARSEELVLMSRQTFETLEPAVRQAMEEARMVEGETANALTELLVAQEKHSAATEQLKERLEVLRLYREADDAIAQNPRVVDHCPAGADPRDVLDEVEALLGAVDRSLEAALQANAAAAALTPLGSRPARGEGGPV